MTIKGLSKPRHAALNRSLYEDFNGHEPASCKAVTAALNRSRCGKDFNRTDAEQQALFGSDS